MNTDDAPKTIPVPLSQRWRDARMRLIPLLVFSATVVSIAMLWKDHVAAPSMVGQAEPVIATVACQKAGVLAQLNVVRFQKVKKDDVIGQVLVSDPQVLASSIAVMQSEIEMLRVNLKPIVAQQKNAMDYNQLRLDWMRQRAQLASARVNLQLAQTEFKRTDELFKDKILSERVYDQAKARQDSLQKEVDELDKLVCEGEKNFQSLQLSNTVDIAKVSEDPLRAAIAVEESKLKLTEAELAPIVLKASMDGIISTVLHRSGEAVVAGQTIVTIATDTPVRIVAYMRPPILNEPKAGMEVEVRTRGMRREVGKSKIREVGAQLESLPATLSGPMRLASADLGLPVEVELPANLKIRAGELVDLVILPAPR